MVLVAVVERQLEKILEKKKIMGEEDNIVCLSNCSYFDAIEMNSKVGIICSVELLSIVDCIQVAGGDPSLLKPELIIDWTKDFVVPFKKGSSVLEAVINIKEPITCGTKKMKLSGYDLTYS